MKGLENSKEVSKVVFGSSLRIDLMHRVHLRFRFLKGLPKKYPTKLVLFLFLNWSNFKKYSTDYLENQNVAIFCGSINNCDMRYEIMLLISDQSCTFLMPNLKCKSWTDSNDAPIRMHEWLNRKNGRLPVLKVRFECI